ncbi:MAG: nucleotide exchange factor GrpE, partial [Patescibacteria group bacterium]
LGRRESEYTLTRSSLDEIIMEDEEKIEYAPDPEGETGEEKGYERVKKMKEEIEKCRKERDDYLGGWQRAKADLLNYKKIALDESEKIRETAAENLLKELLPVLDSLDSALAHAANLPEGTGKGIKNIKKQLANVLEKFGAKPFETLGKKFDPKFCEAVSEVESEGEEEVVAEELQKGYAMNGKVIRPARVIISKKKQI